MKIWSFFLMIVLLASCGKERTFHVKAQNPATGEPYDGLRVVVTSSRTAWNGEKYKTEYDGHLDSNGEAMINVKVKNNRTYSVQCEKPPNTCYTKDIQLYLKDHDEQNPSFLFEYAGCAFLKTHVKNIDCQNANDRILFDFNPVYIEDYNNITPSEEFGCYQNEFIASEVPYGPWEATWEVTKNGNTTYHDSLFYIDEGETYTFLLEY